MNARQMHAAVDSGCDENVQQTCELSKLQPCRLQRKSWHCGDPREMDVLLGLMHRWRRSGEPYIPVCPSVGRNLSEIVGGRFRTTRLLFLAPDNPSLARRPGQRHEFPEVGSNLSSRPGAATSVPRRLTPKIRESEKDLQRELDLS